MKNPVPFKNYFGGKSGNGVYQSIINHIPPHRLLIIPFAGNCGIFKNMKRSEWTLLNDIDRDVINSWYLTGISFSGDVRLFNIDALEFLRCDILDREYSRLHKHAFIYLDPPYLMSTRKGKNNVYKHEFATDEQHFILLTILKQLPPEIKVMISHYPNDLYNNELHNWSTFDFQAKTRKGMATERIYMNYTIGNELHDYQYIGTNFRERERIKRITVNLLAKLDRLHPLEKNKILSAINAGASKK